MPTLAETADSLEAAARQLYDEGKKEMAAELFKAAADVRQAMADMERLPKSTVTAKLQGQMEAAHRQKLSDAQTGKTKHPMLLEARKHGMYSVQDMAIVLGYSKSMMSRILSGVRQMGEAEAAKWLERTGKPWRS